MTVSVARGTNSRPRLSLFSQSWKGQGRWCEAPAAARNLDWPASAGRTKRHTHIIICQGNKPTLELRSDCWFSLTLFVCVVQVIV